MTEFILCLVILHRGGVMPLWWVLLLQSKSLQFLPVQFHFHSALTWPVSIKLEFCGVCVCFTSESCQSADTVRQLQTDSLQWRPDGIISWDSACVNLIRRPYNCIDLLHAYTVYVYMCSACAAIQYIRVTLSQVRALYSPGCVFIDILWA